MIRAPLPSPLALSNEADVAAAGVTSIPPAGMRSTGLRLRLPPSSARSTAGSMGRESSGASGVPGKKPRGVPLPLAPLGEVRDGPKVGLYSSAGLATSTRNRYFLAGLASPPLGSDIPGPNAQGSRRRSSRRAAPATHATFVRRNTEGEGSCPRVRARGRTHAQATSARVSRQMEYNNSILQLLNIH